MFNFFKKFTKSSLERRYEAALAMEKAALAASEKADKDKKDAEALERTNAERAVRIDQLEDDIKTKNINTNRQIIKAAKLNAETSSILAAAAKIETETVAAENRAVGRFAGYKATVKPLLEKVTRGETLTAEEIELLETLETL